jgi:hypothetical protein
MVLTIDLPAQAQARLQAEAEHRGITVDQLVLELANSLPTHETKNVKHRLSFVGIGASGRSGPLDIKRERAALAEAKTAKGD